MNRHFDHTQKEKPFRHRISALYMVLTLSTLLATIAISQAQTPKGHEPYSGGLGTDCAYENVFLGPAIATGPTTTGPTFTSGVTIGQYFARTLGKGIAASPQFELGILGPLPNGHLVDGLASFDVMFADKIPHRHLYGFLTGGYTRVFATGNAVNFGLGVDFGKDEYKRVVRVELRDYYLFTGPQQHVVGLRIGFGKFIAD